MAGTKILERNYTNNHRKRVEEDEQKLKELLESNNEENSEEVVEEINEVEPTGEEKTFKKRYGDLRRHNESVKKDLESANSRIQDLENQLKEKANTPKSKADLKAWMEKYPELAAAVETIASEKATEQFQQNETRFAALEERESDMRRKDAEAEIFKAHKDFDEIRNDDAFHDWVDNQPKVIQDALYDNVDDAQAVIRVLDLYKVDKDKTTKNPSKDAMKEVKTGSNKNPADVTDKKTFKESDVAKMTTKQFEKNLNDILEAQKEGRFIYDLRN